MRSHLVRTLAPALVALLLNAGGATQGLTFAITSDQDSGQGTLRWAIEQANRVAAQASPGNRISLTFASGLAGRTVTLRSFLPYLLASHVTFAVAGTNPAPVTIDTGTGTGTVLVVTGDDVVFQDLVFHKPASSNFPGDNVILVGARGTRFVRCRFTNPVDAGIFAVGAPHTTVQDCRFETTGRGAGILAQDGSDHFRAERCTFSGFTNGAGFAAAGIADVVVRDSTFTGNRTALLLVEVCRSVVFGPGNRITGNLTMAIDASTVAPTRFEDPGDVGLRVTETTITGSGSSAILLQDRCTRVVIEKSVFDGNGANDGAAQIASVGCGSVTLVENVIRNGR
ncbi:MAG TPA: right-handed parallel beta-helix repeat-containing protein, partial [Planctomycetota bacterium]|nr:right-handed parallel beta-helix repeat-containing protein [Planctomycetota bacterium]